MIMVNNNDDSQSINALRTDQLYIVVIMECIISNGDGLQTNQI